MMEIFKRSGHTLIPFLLPLIYINWLWFSPSVYHGTMLYITIAGVDLIFLTILLVKIFRRNLVVLKGDQLTINTLLKTFVLQQNEIVRVGKRSRNFVFFEKSNGEKIDLDIGNLDRKARKRFFEKFQVEQAV